MKHTPRTPRRAPARRELLNQARAEINARPDSIHRPLAPSELQVPFEVWLDPDLTETAQEVYAVLCHTPPGLPLPSAEELSARGPVRGVETIQAALRELRKLGYLGRTS